MKKNPFDQFSDRFLDDKCRFSPEEVGKQSKGNPPPIHEVWTGDVPPGDWDSACTIFGHFCPGGEDQADKCLREFIRRTRIRIARQRKK